uniref:Uncharacterized protein n=1 Tax=Arundo donax TaxID=35708 RepID=A0A0A9DZD0_ARUDO
MQVPVSKVAIAQYLCIITNTAAHFFNNIIELLYRYGQVVFVHSPNFDRCF